MGESLGTEPLEQRDPLPLPSLEPATVRSPPGGEDDGNMRMPEQGPGPPHLSGCKAVHPELERIGESADVTEDRKVFFDGVFGEAEAEYASGLRA
jgi:hypothetical protein